MYPSPAEVSPGPWDPSSPSQATRRPVICARDRHFLYFLCERNRKVAVVFPLGLDRRGYLDIHSGGCVRSFFSSPAGGHPPTHRLKGTGLSPVWGCYQESCWHVCVGTSFHALGQYWGCRGWARGGWRGGGVLVPRAQALSPVSPLLPTLAWGSSHFSPSHRCLGASPCGLICICLPATNDCASFHALICCARFFFGEVSNFFFFRPFFKTRLFVFLSLEYCKSFINFGYGSFVSHL